jgi:hypothetical protein
VWSVVAYSLLIYPCVSLAEYRKKKAKIQEQLLEVQRQRQTDFAAFV